MGAKLQQKQKTKTYLLKQSVDTDASLRLARSLSWAEVGL